MPGAWLPLLCCALCAHALPFLQDRATKTRDPTKRLHFGLKKPDHTSHVQDTLKDNLDVKKWHHRASSRNPDDVLNRPRCGVPDYLTRTEDHSSQNALQTDGRFRRKRFVLFGGRWEKTNLTYRILRTPWQMNLEKVRQLFKEAWQVWSDVTPLNFTEVTDGRADINIDFARYWHVDNLPFDGRGGILAHAFFPKTYRQGDVHFDFDEHWTVGNSMGTDLLQVAAHEFGHVLGLQHSMAPGAVMSPFYSFSYPLRLSEDDKRGIQYLYGSKPLKEKEKEREKEKDKDKITRRPHITETNEISTTPDECLTDFDAVSMIRGELFFFKSGYVWRIRDGKLQAGYPALASRHWKGIPDNIDAAFEDQLGNIWFFQGSNYWVFDAEKQISGPDSVESLGLPVTNIQAALMWGEDKVQKVYFFKGKSYWRFNTLENRLDPSYARSIRDWTGVPDNIDAAFLDRYGFAHFLRGQEYWKFDSIGLRVLEGYPRFIGMDFFGCPASLYK